MHQTSSSLPDLLIHDEETPTTTPEYERTNEGAGIQGKPPAER